jgi:anti-sigma factor RsiW
MSCSPFDLRDYYLKELTDPQQRQVAAHVQDCPACREELERLRLTQAALFSLRDEEIPQRIAFVSDPVFEPSGARRWWAAMLSAALLFSTLARTPAAQSLSSSDVDRRIRQAVAASETRQTARTTQLVHDLVERVDREHSMRLVAESDAEYARKQAYMAQLNDGQYRTLASN